MTHRIHFRVGRAESAACGRKVVPNWLTRDPAEVTCPDCKLVGTAYDTRQPSLFPGP